ncbi:MAG: hypothetical protein HYW90_03125 [Candidatus Sungbacteria bacterium]|nr:hypothetical protein [Candidatus Sungbacteria bacterium]
MEPQKVGFLSRIDYFSEGFRKPLIDVIAEIIRRYEHTHYNILAGGVVYEKLLKERQKEFIKDTLKGLRLSPAERAERKRTLEEQFLETLAQDLAVVIPTFTIPDPEDPKKEKAVDLFITTSPAFDGASGEIVAQHLGELRPDIRVWNAGGDRFLVKYVDKDIWVLTPRKAVWLRGDYYSTTVERVIKDKIRQTTQKPPFIFAVGCFGSSIHKPKGELPFRYTSVPNASRIEEVRVAENQIGFCVMEFPSDGEPPLWRNYSLKDIVAEELSFIIPPEDASLLQKRIVEVLKNRGMATPGMFKYFLKDVPREEVEEELARLLGKKGQGNWPGLVQKPGKKYFFDPHWIQNNLKYSLGSGPWAEDRIVSFACLHAGSVETDYDFFVNELPEIILKRGATVLVDAGDTKEGLKHDLMKKGEIIAGMNNSVQEKFAAHLVGTVMFKVFVERFGGLLKKHGKRKPNKNELHDMVTSALIIFYYILGNHDLWEAELGNEPLELFHMTLVQFLTENIERHLAKCGFSHASVGDVVEEKVNRQEIFTLSSGLKVSVQHPHMSRTLTTSIRPQQMLAYAKLQGCQVAIGGNFHVSENVEEWDMAFGQCVVQQIGTIKHGSNFERHKMKVVDQGVGFLRILSRKGRIFMTESAFYGAKRSKPRIDNLVILNEFISGLGVEQLKSLENK